MATLRITEAEIMDALAAAAQGSAPEDARTIAELADAAGLSIVSTRQALRSLQRAGRLQVHRVRRPAIDGRMANVGAFTILPAKKAAKRG